MGSAEAKLRENFLFAIVTNKEGEVNKMLKDNPDLVSVALCNDKTNPICRSAFLGHQKIAALLLAHGADVNQKSSDGRTPLHWVVIRNNP